MNQVPSLNLNKNNVGGQPQSPQNKNTPTQNSSTAPQNTNKAQKIAPKPPLAWSAHEYHHFEKTTDWYWIVAAVAVAAVALSIYFANYLFALLLVVAAVSLLIHSAKEPEFVHFELNDQGIKVHNNFYLYNTLDTYDIEEYHDDHDNLIHSRLLIKSKKLFMPLIVIHIDQVQPADVRRYLSRHLKHEDLHEPLSQRIAEYLGF